MLTDVFLVSTLLPEHGKISDVPVDKQGNIDFSKDFFGRRCSELILY